MSRNTYEVPGQAGKLAVVTGASDGLGLEIATRLASAAWAVTLTPEGSGWRVWDIEPASAGNS